MNASSLFALIIDSTLKATALLALAWCIGRALRNRSSASRHLVRTCALCAALLLPLLSSLLPAWHVKGIPEVRPVATPKTTAEPVLAPAAFPEQKKTHVAVIATTKPQHTSEKAAAPAVAVVPPQREELAAVIQTAPEP